MDLTGEGMRGVCSERARKGWAEVKEVWSATHITDDYREKGVSKVDHLVPSPADGARSREVKFTFVFLLKQASKQTNTLTIYHSNWKLQHCY